MIINQTVSGGGSAPAHYIEKSVDANGKLIGGSTVINLSGVTDIDNHQLDYAYTENTNITGNINFSDLKNITGEGACRYAFNGCTGITGVNLSNLETITGFLACNSMFAGCTGITGVVDLGKLTTINNGTSNSNVCGSMFAGCTGITGVNLSNLQTINGTSVCANMFNGCTGITGVIDLGKLTTASGLYGTSLMFGGCTGITGVNLSSATKMNGSRMFEGCTGITGTVNLNVEIGGTYQGVDYSKMFKGCTGITRLNLNMLNDIRQSGCCSELCSGCTSLQSIWFYGWTTGTSANNVLNGLVKDVTGCTVHFPMVLQSAIGSWASVTGGLGGTNTTVLFDVVTTLTGADTNAYTRSQKDSTGTSTAWKYNNTLYYTSGTNELTSANVGDNIYSDAACTTAVTTISAIA